MLALPGVRSASVSLLTRLALVQADASLPDAAVLAAVVHAGFEAALEGSSQAGPASGEQPAACLRLRLFNLASDAAEQAALRALRAVDGVASAEWAEARDEAASLGPRLAEVRLDERRCGVRHLLAALRAVGVEARLAPLYAAELQSGAPVASPPCRLALTLSAAHCRSLPAAASSAECAEWRDAFLLAATLSLPTLCLAMLLPMASPRARRRLARRVLGGAASAGTVAQWALVTPVQFLVGARFHAGARAALARGGATMDLLVSLSTSAAYFTSVASVFHCWATGNSLGLGASENFFDSSAMVLTVVSLGKWLESAAKGRTGDAISRLLALSPRTALLLDDEGKATEIDAELVHVSDLLRVPPGARLPCDGHVERGCGHMDVSLLTGESKPVSVKPGDAVQGGTLNGHSPLLVRATAMTRPRRWSASRGWCRARR